MPSVDAATPRGTGNLRELLRALPVFPATLPTFAPEQAPDDPVALFTEWLLDAVRAGVPEPHAMTLATADAAGDPSARVLICKDVDADGWQFASHAGSRKGRELAARPSAALTFYWQPLGRQVRVRGPVTRADAERAAEDFRARSVGARAETLVGRQSRPLGHPDEIEAAVRAQARRLRDEPNLVPPEWTVYTVRALEVEFWQADRDRRHLRLAYRREAPESPWTRQLLWP
ncbi:pyridoxine/pyridoxamine 5'-phosphate oxidase [Allostreptomyces psammosilenae]|uniref:Pyridoxamine 5'-phosphate oxidase n=1 Tax=Allostreptomyces psammosilenae TaxID=1892865 RepID=A0A852ZQU0_9ACTN|nr:pyridoxal 5'-phosphate synthase [Allostreptomyces psammosilenae]NYI04816.1 pyridoxamine 5'-phosphate oxidase [Allostreptomyces psammosilenae]